MPAERAAVAVALAALAVAAAVTIPAIRAAAQQPVTVVIDTELDGYGVVTADADHGGSVTLSVPVGRQLRFRADPYAIRLRNTWNNDSTCWVFGYWKWRPLGYSADAYQDAGWDQETDFVVPDTGVDQKAVEVTAAYWSTDEAWKYPACW